MVFLKFLCQINYEKWEAFLSGSLNIRMRLARLKKKYIILTCQMQKKKERNKENSFQFEIGCNQ